MTAKASIGFWQKKGIEDFPHCGRYAPRPLVNSYCVFENNSSFIARKLQYDIALGAGLCPKSVLSHHGTVECGNVHLNVPLSSLVQQGGSFSLACLTRLATPEKKQQSSNRKQPLKNNS
ncbi:MAG: hypothetical protein HC848_04260 [Limnobacter sp.]|nr:hypothetical protein [Limnobacter sp.]